jgi:hypothetical protein
LVPIENVRLFDLVWTRAGWKRVTRTVCNGWRDTTKLVVVDDNDCRAFVVVTHDHKVLSNGIFINGIEVQKHDKMLVCRNQLSTRLSSSMASGIFGTSAMDISKRAGRAGGACFTGMCGNPSTDQSLTVGRFTTKTRTEEITPLKTFRLSRLGITSERISHAESDYSTQQSDPLTRSRHGLSESREPSPVNSAEIHSRRPGNDPLIVQGTVESVHASKDISLVYDLTVDGCHEMFAGGILVHNCGWTPQSGEKSPDRLDALVWAVTDLLIDPEQMVTRIPMTARRGISPI